MARNYNEIEKQNFRLEIEKALCAKENWRSICKRLKIGKDLYFQEAKVIYLDNLQQTLVSKDKILTDYLDHKKRLINETRKLKSSPGRIALENRIMQETADFLVKVGVLPCQPEVSAGIIKVVFDDGNSEDKV